MNYNSIPVVLLFVLGLLFIFFAQPITEIQARFGLRGIILSRFGIDIRARFIRVAGFILVAIPIYLLIRAWAPQFS